MKQRRKALRKTDSTCPKEGKGGAGQPSGRNPEAPRDSGHHGSGAASAPVPGRLAHCIAGGKSIIPISHMPRGRPQLPRAAGPCRSLCSPFGSTLAFEDPIIKAVEGNMAGAPA